MLGYRVISRILAIAVIIAASPGCQMTQTDCICTADFALVTVMAVDASDKPVTDLTIVVELARTGEVLDVTQDPTLTGRGVYVVFDDGFKRMIHPKMNIVGETLDVTGVGSSGQFDATFKVAVDELCACHVHKKSGPDKVVVEVQNQPVAGRYK